MKIVLMNAYLPSDDSAHYYLWWPALGLVGSDYKVDIVD